MDELARLIGDRHDEAIEAFADITLELDVVFAEFMLRLHARTLTHLDIRFYELKESLMADYAQAVADAKSLLDELVTDVADLKAQIAGQTKPDPAVQAAADDLEAKITAAKTAIGDVPATPPTTNPATPAATVTDTGPQANGTPPVVVGGQDSVLTDPTGTVVDQSTLPTNESGTPVAPDASGPADVVPPADATPPVTPAP